jgi:hypothetical protein
MFYAEAMSSHVKEYFERLASYVGRGDNPRMDFAVWSGLSEGLHSRGLERYFERLAARLDEPHGETSVRGSGEPLRMPTHMGTFTLCVGLGCAYAAARNGQSARSNRGAR